MLTQHNVLDSVDILLCYHLFVRIVTEESFMIFDDAY